MLEENSVRHSDSKLSERKYVAYQWVGTILLPEKQELTDSAEVRGHCFF